MRIDWKSIPYGCKCDHDFYAPPLLVLCSPEFNQELAVDLLRSGMKGMEVWQWMMAMIGYYHTGDLFDHERICIDARHDRRVTDAVLELGDLRRTINRYKKRASGTFTRPLQSRLVPMVTLLDHARSINSCLLDGPCSGHTHACNRS